MDSETVIVPFPPFLSGPSHWLQNRAYAADDGFGSGMRAGKRDRILIVEDDFLVAAEMEATLCDAGFEIVGTVATGEEALQLAEAESPTLAVMDIRLAGDRDGIDTALELFRSHRIRCIFASAHSDQESRLRAAPGAPLGWLQKPYTMASLTEMVRAAVRELRGQSD